MDHDGEEVARTVKEPTASEIRETLNVLVLGAQPILRAGVRAVLERAAGAVVREAEGPADASGEGADELRPDLVVLTSEAGDVPAMLAGVMARRPEARVVVVSHGVDTARLALEAGASGFLSRTARPGELLDAVREVAGGGLYVQAALAGRIMGGQVRSCPLTKRERAILAELARGRSLQQAARHLHLAHGTVKTYLSRAYQKLGVEDRAQALVVALREGWLDAVPAPREDAR